MPSPVTCCSFSDSKPQSNTDLNSLQKPTSDSRQSSNISKDTHLSTNTAGTSSGANFCSEVDEARLVHTNTKAIEENYGACHGETRPKITERRPITRSPLLAWHWYTRRVPENGDGHLDVPVVELGRAGLQHQHRVILTLKFDNMSSPHHG